MDSYDLIKRYDDKILTICYDEIIPGAFKSDIFRLAILDMYGGIYLDAGVYPDPRKYLPLLKNQKLVVTKDRPEVLQVSKYGMDFMASEKNSV